MTQNAKAALYDDPDLSARLDKLDKVSVHALSLEMRCRIFQHIKNSVERRVNEHKLFLSDDKGKVLKIFSGHFAREERTLMRLLETFSYSERYKDFFKGNAQALGEEMASVLPTHALAQTWAGADIPERMDHLKGMARRQFKKFAHDGLRLTPPDTECHELAEGIAGQFFPGQHSLSLHAHDKRIVINHHHAQNSPPHEVFKTQWHEGVHSLCQNFAAAAHHGLLTPANPFYADALIDCERKKYHAATSSSFFPEAYKIDPEENLAYDTEKIFYEAWRDSSRHVTYAAPPPKAARIIERFKRFFL